MAAAALAVLAFGGGWLTWSLHRGTAAHYITQKLERGSVVRTVTASGVVGPTATAPVGARVSGVIQALYCDANIKVKIGPALRENRSAPLSNRVDQDKAGLAAAGARFERTKRHLAQAKAAMRARRPWRSVGPIPKKRSTSRARPYERRSRRPSRTRQGSPSSKRRFMPPRPTLAHTDIVSPD